MRRVLISMFLFVCGCFCLTAQAKLEIFGYYESQMMGVFIKNEFKQLYTNKLRVDLKSDLSDKITFAANFDFITYHGKTEWNVLDFLSEKITSSIPESMKDFYVLPFNNRQFLDNASIKIAFKYFDLTAGKQQISLGTGYAWNPTDVFNIKDLLDPTYEQPGHNAIRLDIPLDNRSTLTTLYSPDEDWRSSARMVQIKRNLGRFDLSLIAIEKTWRFHDYTQFDPDSLYFLEQPETRQLLGGSTVGELFGLGVWAEYAYNWMETTENFYELLVGTDYTFDFQTYVMIELYRNTLGKSDYQEYTINDWMRLMAMEQKSIVRDQVFLFIQHPVTDFIQLGMSNIYSISDNSLAFVPTLSYSFSENVEIFAYLNLNLGKEGTVFAESMGNGGMVRIRVYF